MSQRGRAGRKLAPRIRETAVVLSIVGFVAAFGHDPQLPALDLGQHVLDHGTVPRQPAAHAWLSSTLYAGLFGIAGQQAKVVFQAFAIGVFAFVMLRDALQRGARFRIAAPLVLLPALILAAYPEALVLVFAACMVAIVERDRTRPGLAVWWLVPLAVLWANTHASFLALPLYGGLFAGGLLLEARWTGDPGQRFRAHRLTAVFAAAALATFINPHGAEVHLHALRLLGMLEPSAAFAIWLAMTTPVAAAKITRLLAPRPRPKRLSA